MRGRPPPPPPGAGARRWQPNLLLEFAVDTQDPNAHRFHAILEQLTEARQQAQEALAEAQRPRLPNEVPPVPQTRPGSCRQPSGRCDVSCSDRRLQGLPRELSPKFATADLFGDNHPPEGVDERPGGD